jgi:formylglycine-generating enzyme required for sulfatase activity
VANAYRISKYEVTNAQYTEFLNAVADTDTYTLYDTNMASDARGGITRSGSSGSYSYAVKSGQGSNPVVFVGWHDTLRFANWLHNGQPTGAQNAGTTEDGAYTFTGGATVGGRNVGALTFLPTENEWYKAAYYDAGSASFFDYPMGTNALPSSDAPPGGAASGNFKGPDLSFAVTGSSSFVSTMNYLTDVGAYTTADSPYGTFDQGGNVQEWNETASGGARGLRGTSWLYYDFYLAASWPLSTLPSWAANDVGFRVASIAEPEPVVVPAVGPAGLIITSLAMFTTAVRSLRQRRTK